jgi:hypothetical protein
VKSAYCSAADAFRFRAFEGVSDITRIPAKPLDKVYESATSHNQRAPFEVLIVIYFL